MPWWVWAGLANLEKHRACLDRYMKATEALMWTRRRTLERVRMARTRSVLCPRETRTRHGANRRMKKLAEHGAWLCER